MRIISIPVAIRDEPVYLFYRGWIPGTALIADSDSFLLAVLGPNCIRAYPALLDGGMVVRALSGKPTDGTRTGKRTLKYCYCCGILVFDLWFCCMLSYSWWIILWKVMGASRGMNNVMWRYGLTENRPAATSGRCRGEALRCAATRRVTSRAGVNSGSANLKKTGSFVVKIRNKWLVFQCTVNWSRARLTLVLIASGAAGSRAKFAVE